MRIGVIMGGPSSEREVSLQTGHEILAHLNRDQYEVTTIVVTEPEALAEQVRGMDLALLALHGAYGEDGTVQGTLETLGIPYTGSGVLASSMCMNKDITKRMLRSEGIPTPDWLIWESLDDYSPQAVERLGYPVVVKPNSGGSSIGIQLVSSADELHSAVHAAFQWDEAVLIERCVRGEEITCSILDGELLPTIGIIPVHSEWFDYTAKYSDGAAEEHVIALPADVDARVRHAALASYRVMKCEVYARVDMMLVDGHPYVLEVNTLPGMTRNSLFPKSALAAGIPFDQLLDRIIKSSYPARTLNSGSVPQ